MTVLVTLAVVVLMAWWARLAWRRPDPRHELVFDALVQGMAMNEFLAGDGTSPDSDARELLPSATR